MLGKLIPIPSENLGAVSSALRIRICVLQAERDNAAKRRNWEMANAIGDDIAALTWAMDNVAECEEREIGEGH